MRKTALVVVFLLIAVNGYCKVKVIGKGAARTFDTAGFPPAMKAGYDIMKTKCVRCHTLERVVEAVSTGVSPISGQPFDHGAVRAYGAKMMRKPESLMNKQEIAATVDLLNYLLDQAARR